MEQQNNSDNNLISLLKEFIKEITALVHEHISLFKRDFADNSHKFIKAVISLLFAVVFGYIGLIFLGLLLVSLLKIIIPEWTAIMLVTAIFFGMPLILFVYSINLLRSVFKEPKKSIKEFEKTGEEAKKWLKNIKK